MLNKFTLLCITIVSMILSLSEICLAHQTSFTDDGRLIINDVALEPALPFPWQQIDGHWRGNVNDEIVIFSFETLINANTPNQLKINQIDSVSKKIVASGIGSENKNIINTTMTSYDNSKYLLTLRQISDPIHSGADNNKKVKTIITVQGIGEEQSNLFFIEKLNKLELEFKKSKPF